MTLARGVAAVAFLGCVAGAQGVPPGLGQDASGAVAAPGQELPVVVRDAGPGPEGRYLESVLRRPDTRVVVRDTFTLARDSVVPGSLVLLGKRANLAGRVRGDVIVVGGDLVLKPGGQIEGRGIAIGGGAYGSLLGNARGGLASYRDFTFDFARTPAAIELRYRENYVTRGSGLSWPIIHDLRLPTYDRSSGLSLAVGPLLEGSRGVIEPLATYRSQLGRVDLSVAARLDLGRKTWIEASGGRGMRTNEDWVNSRLSNSLNSLLVGHDERNWYRVDAARGAFSRRFETTTLTATYSIGGLYERASAVRPAPGATGGPWSFHGRDDVDDMLRPNPQIPGGDVTSVIAAGAHRWSAGRVSARLDLDAEVPLSVSTGEDFVQATVDARVDFPTFGNQRYRFELHGVATLADTAPGQRLMYLGGSSTIPTDEILVRGGDQLLFMESRYEIPVERIKIPFVGSPVLSFRHILGSVGLRALPDFTQVVGIRLSVPFIRAEALMDTGTRKTRLRAGLSLSR